MTTSDLSVLWIPSSNVAFSKKHAVDFLPSVDIFLNWTELWSQNPSIFSVKNIFTSTASLIVEASYSLGE